MKHLNSFDIFSKSIHAPSPPDLQLLLHRVLIVISDGSDPLDTPFMVHSYTVTVVGYRLHQLCEELCSCSYNTSDRVAPLWHMRDMSECEYPVTVVHRMESSGE